MKKLLLIFLSLVCAEVQLHGQSLLHYWNFNNSASENLLLSPSVSLVGGGSIVHNSGTNSGGFASTIQITSNTTGQGFEVNNVNSRNADAAGAHLRFNNPIGGNLVFSIPSTGYKNVLVKYATRRSGSGAYNQHIDYSTNGTDFISLTSILPPDGNPTLQTIDLAGLADVDNNPNLKIRIRFSQGGGGLEGNNRFDNFTVEGYAVNGTDNTAPVLSFSPLTNTENVPVTVQPVITFNEDIRLADNSALTNANVDDVVELRLENASGTAVPFDASISGRVITITPATNLSNKQKYYVALKANSVEDLSDNAVSTIQSAVFTTIAVQTQFQPGDLLPVAYRMNATSTEDEAAFLTLVNILPGTMINFTDGKYTSNATPQCAGGLTWTAPAEGVSAGTVIRIQTSASIASVGSLSGSGFGLSSSGDQVIVYTGTPENPAYITALSANAWVMSNSSCSGSLSMIPAGLADGISSINLSTATGNAAGLSVNAYYNGIQQGSSTELKAAILNPANWITSASGTSAQTWPNFAFPGPPVVHTAKVINQTTLELRFNNDLNASASNLANFSGITGLSSVSRSDNGVAADVLTLTFSTPFAAGQNYALVVDGIVDSEGRPMVAPYSFNFSYNSRISFKDKFLSVDEGAGSVTITLMLENPSASSASLVYKDAPFSNAGSDDLTFTSAALNFTGSSTATQTITIPINDDNLSETDEYFVLGLENLNGLSLSGKQYLTIYIKDNDRKAPVASEEIKLNYVSSFKPNATAGSTTEIVVFEAAGKRLYMSSAVQDRLDIADFSNPSALSLIRSVDMSPYGGITSIAVRNGVVAVASPANPEHNNGSVVFLNTDGDFQKQVTVGALPDMITFSPDGAKIITANEGQPTTDYSIDPEGSVSIIDISGGLASVDQSKVHTLDFTLFNSQEAALIAAGVRKTKSSSTLSQDLEPEYVTISADSKKAWVTLQENNAVAEINLENLSITEIKGLGKKDFSAGAGFDASDNSGKIHISNYPVKSYFMPDGMANFSANGKTYLVTANEGDEKEYGSFVERTTVSAVSLDPTIFPNAEVLKEDHNIGRLRITNLNGDTDNDGDYDELMMVGARSFSIWDADTKALVYDSKDDFELITSQHPVYSSLFNSDSESNSLKNRSRSKGPEPEGVTVAMINGQTYAFVGLERIGGVMVYNITDPQNVKFVDYKNNRSTGSYTGDFGPEGINYIAANQSPDGKPYLVVANEISGSISVFEVGTSVLPVEMLSFDAKLQKTGQVKLSWATASEVNNDFFTIERSIDGKTFKPLAKLSSKGDKQQSYSFTDAYPLAGTNYYRLTQTDKDGSVSRPWIASANTSALSDAPGLRIYPNPLSGNSIHVEGSELTGNTLELKIFDLQGRIVCTGTCPVENGGAQMQLPIRLPAGTYIVKVGELGSSKLIVRN